MIWSVRQNLHHPAKHGKRRFVSSLSSGLGVTSPLGWLCSKRKLTAPTRSACRKNFARRYERRIDGPDREKLFPDQAAFAI